jgi:hypothetical protein
MRRGARTCAGERIELALRAVTGPGLPPGFRQPPRARLGVEFGFGFPSGGYAHFDSSQSQARQPPLRGTQDTCDYLGRNFECLCDLQSRMGSLTAQPEVQADHFFLPRLQHP